MFIHTAMPAHIPATKNPRQRADALVYAQGLADSRESAKRLIMAGSILLAHSGERVDKAGHPYAADTRFVRMQAQRFVSRGGYKLLTALEYFQLDVSGSVCLDAGASTGGFTDCLLQHGAKRVYAVDVGHGQLHERLRADARVINMERTNLRLATPECIPEPIDMVVADVSFISLTLALPPCMAWLVPGGRVLALIKPQFELGPQRTRKGVVREAHARQEAVDTITAFCARELGLILHGCVPSNILGPKGNQEYILYGSVPMQ